jgi:serpin B
MASSSTTTTVFEHFATKLFSQVAQQNNGKNIFLSPASIALAISMCTIGARNETLQQMLNVLGTSSIQQLTKLSEQAMQVFSNANKDRQLHLRLANRLYGQKAYKIQQDYLNLVQKSFQADIKLEDFLNESEKVVQTINTWVEDQTNNLIRNLLSSDDITPDTRLVLISCIYFKVNIILKYLTENNVIFLINIGCMDTSI